MLPVLGIHVAYVLADDAGHVPLCFPYWDSCTSISRVGRQSPGSYVFRATVIPTAVFMMVYWRFSFEWLQTLGGQGSNADLLMLILGLVASLGLILYATVLGSIGPKFYLQRRVGVTNFYICTFVAQFIMTGQLRTLEPSRSTTLLTGICVTVAVLGLISLGLWAFYDRHDRVDDAFEWALTALLQLHILTTWWAWRASGFKAGFEVERR